MYNKWFKRLRRNKYPHKHGFLMFKSEKPLEPRDVSKIQSTASAVAKSQFSAYAGIEDGTQGAHQTNSELLISVTLPSSLYMRTAFFHNPEKGICVFAAVIVCADTGAPVLTYLDEFTPTK